MILVSASIQQGQAKRLATAVLAKESDQSGAVLELRHVPFRSTNTATPTPHYSITPLLHCFSSQGFKSKIFYLKRRIAKEELELRMRAIYHHSRSRNPEGPAAL